jgi:DNA-directed RNA polymerase I subunit RPA1
MFIQGKGPKALRKAEKLKLKLTRVTLADVLENVYVTEALSINEGERARIYGLQFNFLRMPPTRIVYALNQNRFCITSKKPFF